jgi:hypothetical protein
VLPVLTLSRIHEKPPSVDLMTSPPSPVAMAILLPDEVTLYIIVEDEARAPPAIFELFTWMQYIEPLTS